MRRSQAPSARLCCRWMTDASGDGSNAGPPNRISIDTSGLIQAKDHSHAPLPHKEPETAMARHIKSLIRVCLRMCICLVRGNKSTKLLGSEKIVKFRTGTAVWWRPDHCGEVHVGMP
jgi:hypothetical protein